MKNNLILLGLSLSLSLVSCGNGNITEENPEETNEETVDSTTIIDEPEENIIAFDGTDTGDFLLYGHSEITAEEHATVDEMFQEFEITGSFNRTVEVSINEVCKKAGCWITFLGNDEKDVRVFFRDHFTIPVETPKGTDAVLYGSLTMDTLSVDFQRHLLDDAVEAGEEIAQEEYDAITEDKIEVSFDCESILVKK